MNNSKDQSKDQMPQATVPTAPATDTSFSANMASYSVKLIYLPDYSHPMALQEQSGLFGNVALAPNLQDGWMLTSLSSSNDSGGAAALAAVASLVGSAVGGGASGGGAKVASTTEETAAGGVDANKLAEELSKPGGINATKLAAVLKTAGGQETTHTSITPLKPIPPMWGENVLPAGLYAFDYKPLYAGPYQPVHGQTPPDPQPGAGELLGLKPLIFFCAQGPETPIPRTVPEPGLAFTNLYQTPCYHPPGDGS